MKHEDKNIQLSEKLEYLMCEGALTINKRDTGETTYIYINPKMNICKVRHGGRLLDFVNELVEIFGLYPLVQKFHRKK